MGQVGVTTVYPARGNDAERRFALLHHPHLHRRGVGTQQTAVTEVEGVVHGPRRVVGRNIQGFEVVEVVFHFRPFGNIKAQTQEEILNAATHAGDRVQIAGQFAPARQGHIHGFTGQLLGQGRFFHGMLAGGDGILDFLFALVDHRTGLGALFRAQLAKALHQGADLAFLAQVLHPDIVQGPDIASLFDVCQGSINQGVEIFH